MKIILEIANNHMGDVAHGLRLIQALADVTRSYDFEFYIKFQFRDLKTLIHKDFAGSDLKYIKRFEETELSDRDWEALFREARKCNFGLMVTPFDEISVQRLNLFGADELKVASCSIGDWPLFEEIASTWTGPITRSTGGATLQTVDDSVAFWRNRAFHLTLMHCVALYPTPAASLQLGQLQFFNSRYPELKIGYSTHESPDDVVSGPMALALGATVFEKHVGLADQSYGLNDYSASPTQLNAWLGQLLHAQNAIGNKTLRRDISPEESLSIQSLARGIFAKRDLATDVALTKDDVYFALPAAKDSYLATQFSKYNEAVTKTAVVANSSLSSSNTDLSLRQESIKNCYAQVMELVEASGVILPKHQPLEISHHYGLANFSEHGMAMITVVNEDYCKKLLFLLPQQQHPAQFHKIKSETFNVLWGDLLLTVDGEIHELSAGDLVTINPNMIHAFKSNSGCVIEEISSNHQSSDSYYIDPAITENKNRKTFVRIHDR